MNTIMKNMNTNMNTIMKMNRINQLPQECVSLIFAYDSTYHEFFQNKVLMMETRTKGEFLFYHQIVEKRYKDILLHKNLLLAFSSINHIMPPAHELKIISLMTVSTESKLHYCELEYEQVNYHFILWWDCPLSLDPFVTKYIAKYIEVKGYASDVCVDCFKTLCMNTVADCFSMHQPFTSRRISPPFSSKKVYIQCNPNYYLSLCSLPGNTIVIQIDYIDIYTFHESQIMQIPQNVYEENELAEFLDILKSM